MARPAPPIIYTQTTGEFELKIVEALAIYAVFHNGAPINIHELKWTTYSHHKYPRVSFSNPAHAVRLARKLNKRFQTSLFSVFRLTAGVTL